MTPTRAFPIVALGASAGGLEAFTQFLQHTPANSGMAFVLLSHLDPEHDSLLANLLQSHTTMPVALADDQTKVQGDHVYVLPPNREMRIVNGVLQLAMAPPQHGPRLPIDTFFCSLAVDQGAAATAIILSGTGSDGTLGLHAIVEAGGHYMVQDPAGAKFPGMPQSAIDHGFDRWVVDVPAMPQLLAELTAAPDPAALRQIMERLLRVSGNDFTHYKQSTVLRRIHRRMAVLNLPNLSAYVEHLQQHTSEAPLLLQELLINVTRFFRDPEVFEVLRQQLLPQLQNLQPNAVFRVWVAGCASGEEAYSLAILLHELRDTTRTQQGEFALQIYATDLDADAIAQARSGLYGEHITQQMTPERLQRYFVAQPQGYKIRKEIRESVVFAVQNVIKDPPFTRIDLLSCRNVMIYLEPNTQARLMPVLHYALKPGGLLLLSPSESVLSHPELFGAIDRQYSLFRASAGHSGKIRAVPASVPSPLAWLAAPEQPKPPGIAETSQRALLQAFAPASVTTDLQGNILYVHGDVSGYLRQPPGVATHAIQDMARGLQLELRTALQHARDGLATLNREVTIKTDGALHRTDLSVRLLTAATGPMLLVSFAPLAPPRKTRTGRGVAAERVAQLERELSEARNQLQSTIEAQQVTNEELQSANEELQSTNEELQSANEELETSREELQSLNEETITVNAELNTRIEQLSIIENDMKNLFDNINIGTLFLDHKLQLRRYTRDATKIYRLIPGDIGRPLADIKSHLRDDTLLHQVQTVFDTLIPYAQEVCTEDGVWYLLRIQPYRTLDNVIAGAVLTFTDISELKQAGVRGKRHEAMLSAALEIARLGCWELDVSNHSLSCSSAMRAMFGLDQVNGSCSLSNI